jgi:hypothetical protein
MARDVALRELDQAGFRIVNLGTPTAANDATKTDNTTIPRASTGTGAPGTSLLAAPADHVHPSSGGAGGGGVFALDDPSCQSVTGTAEDLVYETSADLSVLTPAEMSAMLVGIAKVSTGQATFNLRLGGTPGQVDGTVIASMTTSSTSFTTIEGTAQHVANSHSRQILKITGLCNTANAVAYLYGKSVQLVPSVSTEA